VPRRRPALAALLAAAAMAGGPARAVPSANGLTDEMRSLYAGMFHDQVPTQTLPALQRQARDAVADGDLDGGGLSRRDIELARDFADSSARADRIRSYFGSDLNRDGVLTLDEYKARLRAGDVEAYYFQYEHARQENRAPPAAVVEDRTRDDGSIVQTFNAIDADRDGRVTLREVFAYNQPVAYAPAERFVEAEKYLVLDQDGDGNVTMAEVDSTSAAFLAEQARAGVGPLPQAAADKESGGQPRLEDVVQCRLPRPSATARIVRLGAREGGQISSVALGGQDLPTYAVSVEIELGAEPLYIVATSDAPTIWRFSGATQRVEAFVGSSRDRDARAMWPAVGATGLARARFHTAPNACFGDFDGPGTGTTLAPAEVSRLVARRLGRPLDLAFAAYQPQGVRLPSAQPFRVPAEVPEIFRDLRNRQAAGEWRDFLVYFPAGIATLDPRRIVTSAVPERYEVYSYAAGMAQLLEAGAVIPVANGMVNFEIVRRIRFPAGLAGGHSEAFRLADGVPPPIGNPGHSRVMSASRPAICLIGCR
jgi:EF hand domain-containing protein